MSWTNSPAFGVRDKPVGGVRLLVPRVAGTAVLGPKLAQFTRDYPDVVLDITADDTRLDIVAGGFDGIQFGEYIQKDMIAVRVSKDFRAAIVGSPAYFKSHPRPKAPRDLMRPR
jgi:DNA-binding transcriptional LysR family regulator